MNLLRPAVRLGHLGTRGLTCSPDSGRHWTGSTGRHRADRQSARLGGPNEEGTLEVTIFSWFRRLRKRLVRGDNTQVPTTKIESSEPVAPLHAVTHTID